MVELDEVRALLHEDLLDELRPPGIGVGDDGAQVGLVFANGAGGLDHTFEVQADLAATAAGQQTEQRAFVGIGLRLVLVLLVLCGEPVEQRELAGIVEVDGRNALRRRRAEDAGVIRADLLQRGDGRVEVAGWKGLALPQGTAQS